MTGADAAEADPVCGDLDPAATRALYEHAKWLFDAEDARLGSLESRAVAIVGWSGTQLALMLTAIALVAVLPGGWAKTTGMALLSTSVGLSVVAIFVVLASVVWARGVAAPTRDLRSNFAALNGSDRGATSPITERDVLTNLTANLIADGTKYEKGALVALQGAIDKRADGLNWSTRLVAGSLALAAAAAPLFILAAQGA